MFSMRVLFSTLAIAFSLLLWALSPVPGGVSAAPQEKEEVDWAAKLPEGSGREIVVEVCVACHSLERVVKAKKTSGEWKAAVEEMISRGAQLGPDEAGKVSAYLGKNLGTDKARK